MYKHILYAFDLSETGMAIAKQVVDFARAFDAKLSIIHVIEPEPAYGFIEPTNTPSDEALSFTKKRLAELKKATDYDFANEVVECGSVKHCVTKTAESLGVDLIVVGSHGIHGIADLLGSTAGAINNRANCDVLTLRINRE